ncbi:MAG TPA: cob(I)yrinic acid a,c-diamide adenosyltransferase [Chloroflexota bacterium]|nr:cob(I)yrinic acid a,c-diamide adenosyltransferase [Chloroflexota bacterium]
MDSTRDPGRGTRDSERSEAVDKKRRQGLVMIWTGNGKGKTTASIGLAVRAAGHSMRVLFLQFIKGQWKTGERESLRLLAPYVEHVVMGRGFTIERLRNKKVPMDEHHAAAQEAFAFAREAVHGGKYQIVILDEIMASIHAGLIPLEDVLELVRSKPPMLHLVLTGRRAPAELVALADLVSEVQPVKHPLQAGIPAQRGIEF